MMKRIALAFAVLAALAVPGSAQAPTYKLIPLGYQQISASTLASATLLTVPAGTNIAFIQVEGTSVGVRFRDDGTAPTSTVGMPLPAAGLWFYEPITALQFIASTGSPILDVLYYRCAGC